MTGPTNPEARPMQPNGTAPTGFPHDMSDCQAILQNRVITFCWLYNAEVSITMLSGDSIHLVPKKLKTSVNTEERSKCCVFTMQTVAHRLTLCLPWFGRKLVITRTRPILDHLVKLGFGI